MAGSLRSIGCATRIVDPALAVCCGPAAAGARRTTRPVADRPRPKKRLNRGVGIYSTKCYPLRHVMRIFKTKTFHRWAAREGLDERRLTNAVEEMQRGLMDADLGGQVFKKTRGTPRSR